MNRLNNLHLILAQDLNGVIGVDQSLPFVLPQDLKRFQTLTTSNVVVMGRKTYDSIPKSNRPLKNRENIVFTRDKTQHHKNVIFMNELKDVLEYCRNTNKEVFIIGGKSMYDYFVDYACHLHLTTAHIQIDTRPYEEVTKVNIEQAFVNDSTKILKTIHLTDNGFKTVYKHYINN